MSVWKAPSIHFCRRPSNEHHLFDTSTCQPSRYPPPLTILPHQQSSICVKRIRKKWWKFFDPLVKLESIIEKSWIGIWWGGVCLFRFVSIDFLYILDGIWFFSFSRKYIVKCWSTKYFQNYEPLIIFDPFCLLMLITPPPIQFLPHLIVIRNRIWPDYTYTTHLYIPIHI